MDIIDSICRLQYPAKPPTPTPRNVYDVTVVWAAWLQVRRSRYQQNCYMHGLRLLIKLVTLICCYFTSCVLLDVLYINIATLIYCHYIANFLKALLHVSIRKICNIYGQVSYHQMAGGGFDKYHRGLKPLHK